MENTIMRLAVTPRTSAVRGGSGPCLTCRHPNWEDAAPWDASFPLQPAPPAPACLTRERITGQVEDSCPRPFSCPRSLMAPRVHLLGPLPVPSKLFPTTLALPFSRSSYFFKSTQRGAREGLTSRSQTVPC